MITKINTLSMAESGSMYTPNPISGYDNEFGFYQIGLDLVHEDMEMFNAFANHDYKEIGCVNESELAALNEGSVKEFFTKIIEAIKRFLDKLWQAIKRFLAQFQGKLDLWGKKAKFFEDHVLPKWKDSNEKIRVSYLDSRGKEMPGDDKIRDLIDAISGVIDKSMSYMTSVGNDGEVDIEAVKKSIAPLAPDEADNDKGEVFKLMCSQEDMAKTKENAKKLIGILKNGKTYISAINNLFHGMDKAYSAAIGKLKTADVKAKNGAEAVSAFSTAINDMMKRCNTSFTIFLNTTVHVLNLTSKGLSDLAKGVTKGSGSSDKKEKEESKPEAEPEAQDASANIWSMGLRGLDEMDDPQSHGFNGAHDPQGFGDNAAAKANQGIKCDPGDTNEDADVSIGSSEMWDSDSEVDSANSDIAVNGDAPVDGTPAVGLNTGSVPNECGGSCGGVKKFGEAYGIWAKGLEGLDDVENGEHTAIITPGDPDVDETKVQAPAEVDNYAEDPAKDDGADDYIEDTDGVMDIDVNADNNGDI